MAVTPEVAQIIEPRSQSAKIARAVAVAVLKGADMQFINDSTLIPERIFFQGVAAILADDALRYLWDGHVFQKSLEIPAIKINV